MTAWKKGSKGKKASGCFVWVLILLLITAIGYAGYITYLFSQSKQGKDLRSLLPIFKPSPTPKGEVGASSHEPDTSSPEELKKLRSEKMELEEKVQSLERDKKDMLTELQRQRDELADLKIQLSILEKSSSKPH